MGFTGCCPADGDLETAWRDELKGEEHEISSQAFEDLAGTMKVIAHPLRIRILFLLEKKDHSVFELMYILKEPQNLLSYNLGVLRKAGLVEPYYRSRRKTYRLSGDRNTPLAKFIRQAVLQ